MSKTDMDVYKENLRLKKEFFKRNLNLEADMDFMLYHLEIENKLENSSKESAEVCFIDARI